MFNWLKTWRERRATRKLVSEMGSLLKHRYGFQEFYSPEQVSATAAVAKLDQDGEACVIAMYVQPEDSIRILTKMRDAKWAHELRKIMIGQCFGLGYDNDSSANYNVFAHHSSGGHPYGGFGHAHGSYDGGHSHGSDSGGHGGGDGGGGH